MITGPDKISYAVAPLPEGTYFFHCEIHPTTMVGEITSAPGGGEDAGDGGEEGSTGPVVAQGLQFSTSEIDLPADQASTLTLDNQEAGVPHNISIYTDESLADALVPRRDHHRPRHDRLRRFRRSPKVSTTSIATPTPTCRARSWWRRRRAVAPKAAVVKAEGRPTVAVGETAAAEALEPPEPPPCRHASSR